MSASRFPFEPLLYAGRWVAIVRGQVVCSALTAHAALVGCRAARTKDEPSLRYVPASAAVTQDKG